MIGSRVGAWRLLAAVGEGATGTVYRAVAEEPAFGLPAGTVASVKLVHSHLLDHPDAIRRFARESRIGARIRHRNVVSVHGGDAAVVDGVRRHFLVMEYVEGRTLRDLLAELGHLPEGLCRQIGLEAAEGLGAIHDAGSVHRDVKPDNLILAADQTVKLTDLGSAQVLDEETRLSRAGAFVGSVAYAAPEQFQAGVAEVDGRADLHALGVVLYELVTGRHPFAGGDVRSVLHRVLEAVPPRARAVRPECSPFFDEVLATLLQKRPQDRFASAAELRRVLEEGEAGPWWTDRAGAASARPTVPAPAPSTPRPPRRGREEELRALGEAFEEVRRGAGRVVLIEGDVGVGKTRLVDELATRLDPEGTGIEFLSGAFPPCDVGTPAGAFVDACRARLGAGRARAGLERFLTGMPTLVPAFEAFLRGEPAPPGAEPLTRESLPTAFIHVLRALARERPVLLRIDDVDFAPEEGRTLFAAIAFAIPADRVLLVGTLHPAAEEGWVLRLLRSPHVRRLPLCRLPPEGTALLVADAFRSERIDPVLASRVASASDGNPLFALEIVRAMRDSGAVVRGPDDTWRRTGDSEGVALPNTVRDVVRSRVAPLDDAHRALLDVAACCGREFDPETAGDALGLPRLGALQAFGRLERVHGLVRSAGRRLAFDHPLLPEVLHADLPPLLRERYHLAIACALEARAGAAGRPVDEMAPRLAAEIAEQFSLGAEPQRALRYVDVATAYCNGMHQHERSLRLLDRVLSVSGPLDPERRLSLSLRRIELLRMRGDLALHDAALEEAAGWLRDDTSPELRMRIERAAGIRDEGRGDVARARAHFERFLETAREARDRHGEAAALDAIGVLLRHSGRLEEALSYHERSLEIARETGYLRGEAAFSGNLGVVLSDVGRFARARACHLRHLEIATAIGDRRGRARALANLGVILADVGELEEARAHFADYVASVREIGDRSGEALGCGNLGTVLRRLGRTEEARESCERSVSTARKAGERRTEAWALQNLALVEEQAGDLEGARTLLEDALERRRELGVSTGVADSLCELGRILLAFRLVDAAAARLAEALAIASGALLAHVVVLASARRLALPGGGATEAAAHLARWEHRVPVDVAMEARLRLWEASRDPAHREEALRLLERVLLHEGEEDRARMTSVVPLYRAVRALAPPSAGGSA